MTLNFCFFISIEKSESSKKTLGSYKCNFCLEAFTEIHDLQGHIQKWHAEEMKAEETETETENLRMTRSRRSTNKAEQYIGKSNF